jgi:hypothetical protein
LVTSGFEHDRSGTLFGGLCVSSGVMTAKTWMKLKQSV